MPLSYSRKNGLVLTDVHINSTLRCNLSCVGCNSFSDMGVDDGFTIEERISWLSTLHAFSNRHGIDIPIFTILGGEPFLDDGFLKIGREIARLWPGALIDLYTNGLLLSARQDWIRECTDINVRLHVSIHDVPEKIKMKILTGLALWQQQGMEVILSGNGPENNIDTKGLWAQTVVYDQDKVWPHTHGDPYAAWLRCSIRDCHTLQDHRFYHCPITALLPSLLTKTKQMDEPKWQPYLEYDPLDLRTATEQDVARFFSTTPGHVCSMCPKNSTSIPLVPAVPQDMHRFDKDAWRSMY